MGYGKRCGVVEGRRIVVEARDRAGSRSGCVRAEQAELCVIALPRALRRRRGESTMSKYMNKVLVYGTEKQVHEESDS